MILLSLLCLTVVALSMVGVAPHRAVAFFEAQRALVAQTRIASTRTIVLANEARTILEATAEFLARRVLGPPALTLGHGLGLLLWLRRWRRARRTVRGLLVMLYCSIAIDHLPRTSQVVD